MFGTATTRRQPSRRSPQDASRAGYPEPPGEVDEARELAAFDEGVKRRRARRPKPTGRHPAVTAGANGAI
jgi:hypothetical protein